MADLALPNSTLLNENALLRGQKRVLEMVATGAPLADTLAELTLLIEAREPGMRCGILIVTDDGAHFRRGAGPSLPEIYHDTLDGVPITPPYLGACGEAAHLGTPIVVPDVANDTRWAEDWRDLVLSCGLRSLRSTPVRRADGSVLASFAMYYDRPRDPQPADPDIIDIATHLAAIALERSQSEAALRERDERLRAELVAMQRLQDISTLLIQEGDVDVLYDQLLNAATMIMHSDMASLQMLHQERGELQLLAWKGFHPESAAFWEWVSIDSSSSCGAAFVAGRQVLVPDIESCDFLAGTADYDAYRRSDILAVQSTPLISRSGGLLGMISTHWRKPHQPAERDLRLLDVLARQASDLIERTQAEKTMREREARLRLLASEVDHRAKNVLTSVQAVTSLTQADTVPGFRAALMGRIDALARVHAVLARNRWIGADLGRVVEEELAAFRTGEDDRLTISGPVLALRTEAAQALSMILHELATNAVKYGALSMRSGRVGVDWSWDAEDRLVFNWIETGGPAIKAPTRRGFGSNLIESAATRQLDGTIRFDWLAEGLACRMTIPRDSLTDGADAQAS